MTNAHLARRLTTAMGLAAALVFAAPLAAQVVARVNGAPITNEQLDRVFNDVLRERKLNLTRMRNPAQARDLKVVALDRLIREELFWQQAQKEQLVVDDATVDASFKETRAQFATQEAFETQLMRQGTDEQGFRVQARRMLSADRYAQRVVDQRVKVTDADIEGFYRLNKGLFEKPEHVRVRTLAIVAPAGQGPDERRAARRRIEALRQEIVKGGDFDALARQHSQDPTRQWGGELDPAPLASLPEWMQGPVAKLKPGEISGVIETAAGYHLLKLDARVPGHKVPLAEARQGIYDYLQGSRAQEALEAAGKELRATAKVEMLVPL
jgi:parvulin-like peptidyl-prolyl isomerase